MRAPSLAASSALGGAPSPGGPPPGAPIVAPGGICAPAVERDSTAPSPSASARVPAERMLPVVAVFLPLVAAVAVVLPLVAAQALLLGAAAESSDVDPIVDLFG